MSSDDSKTGIASLFPSPGELAKLLEEAKRFPNKPCRLVWKNAEKTLEYSVTCALSQAPKPLIKRNNMMEEPNEIYEPSWVLMANKEGEKSKLLDYKGRDLPLLSDCIRNTVLPQSQQMAQSVTGQIGQSGQYESPRNSNRFERPMAEQEMPTAPMNTDPRQSMHLQTSQLTLAGDLKKVGLTDVLQSISLLKMTGRLDLSCFSQQVMLYFTDGTLDCIEQSTGFASENQAQNQNQDDIFYELLLWEDGSFNFLPGWNAPAKTIKKKLDFLLLEGASIADYNAALKEKEITEDSIIEQTEKLDDASLMARIAKGIPAQAKLQVELYKKASERVRLGDIVAGYTKPRWVTAIFGLVNSNLIKNTPKDTVAHVQSDEYQFSLKIANKSLCRPETSVLSQAVFLRDLQNHTLLARKHSYALSVTTYALGTEDQGPSLAQIKVLDELHRECFGELGALYHFDSVDFRLLSTINPYSEQSHSYAQAELFVDYFGEQCPTVPIKAAVSSISLQESKPEYLIHHTRRLLKDLKSASKAVATSQALEETKWWAYFSAAEALLNQGDTNKAIDEYRNALNELTQLNLEFDERLRLVLERLSKCYRETKRYDLAKAVLELLIDQNVHYKLHNEIAASNLDMAELCVKIGEIASAKKALGKATSSIESGALINEDGERLEAMKKRLDKMKAAV